MKVRKAVIPAAGLGTRFLPATKAQGIEEKLIITGRNSFFKQGIKERGRQN